VVLGRDTADKEWSRRVWLWAAAREECLWLDKDVPSRECRVAGVVSRLRLDPEARRIETTISDGAASLVARWELRWPPSELRAAPGVGLILEGIVRMDSEGTFFMVEPKFEVVPGPDRV
jgi:hypothetical protein